MAELASSDSKVSPDLGPDRLSDLPDCILIAILSLLPLQDSARTTVLSNRWRYLWTFSSLNIHGRFLKRQNPNPKKRKRSSSQGGDSLCTISVINKILARHRGPIDSFLFSGDEWARFLESRRSWEILDRYNNWSHFTRNVNSWIQTLAQRGVRHLNLRYRIPHCILDCQFLQSLDLIEFEFLTPPTIPANLRELRLSRVKLADGILSRILSGCRFLDTLELHRCRGLIAVCVTSVSLRKFRFKMAMEMVFVTVRGIVVDAPNLEHLMLDDSSTVSLPVKVINSPKLQVLGVINARVRRIQIGHVHYEPELPINLHACVHSIKTVAIRVNFCHFDQAKYVAACLKCFPCLETLDLLIADNTLNAPRPWKWEEEVSSECLERHLKVVKLKGTVGHHYDIEFARFLVQNAQVLKVMSLHCVYSETKRWQESKLKAMCFENRASLDAQVTFTRDNHLSCEFSTWEGLF